MLSCLAYVITELGSVGHHLGIRYWYCTCTPPGTVTVPVPHNLVNLR